MTESNSELDLVVGSMIMTRPDEDSAAFESEKEWLQDVQDLLREEGVELDLRSSLAQPGAEVWKGGIQNFYDLYQLRRLAAHLERGDDIQTLLSGPAADGEDIDELLEDIWDDEAQTRFPHLIKHQGDGGYYLPVEFAEPIWVGEGDEDEDDELLEDLLEEDTTVSFGSSVALLRELTDLQDLFRQGNVPPGGHTEALQVLRTAAEQSVNSGLPIILW